MPKVKPGKQYLGVMCENCKNLTPIIEVDPGTEVGQHAGAFQAVCAHCGHAADYPTSELRMLEVHRKQ